jgi:hypothetical protein
MHVLRALVSNANDIRVVLNLHETTYSFWHLIVDVGTVGKALTRTVDDG